MPFQRWHKFKEAFAPELVQRAVCESPVPVRHLLDPFGGSGTSALASQFLGVHPTTIEVNPYLADVIQAKVTTYDSNGLRRDLASTLRRFDSAERISPQKHSLGHAPGTFVEPGLQDRWLFDCDVATEIATLDVAIQRLRSLDSRRLFRVLLGGILVDLSNVVVSGKGRRYRRHWREARRDPALVRGLFVHAAEQALLDVEAFGQRPEMGYRLIRGDTREVLIEPIQADLVLFSPPYPNSFDYTDVYNLELWTLGYLQSRDQNRTLRQQTLTSHVQVTREFALPPPESPTLASTLEQLHDRADRLWTTRIPDMVGAYFADLAVVLKGIACGLAPRGRAWVVVGDSRYAGVQIKVDVILAELAAAAGLKVVSTEPFRSMRTSPQQGGDLQLAETLVVFGR